MNNIEMQLEKQIEELLSRADEIALSQLFTQLDCISSKDGKVSAQLSGEHPFVGRQFVAVVEFAEEDGLKGFVEALDDAVHSTIEKDREWLCKYCESDEDEDKCISAIVFSLRDQKEAFNLILAGQEAVEARKFAKSRLLTEARSNVAQAILATAEKLEQGVLRMPFDTDEPLYRPLAWFGNRIANLVGLELLRQVGYAEEDLAKVYEAQCPVIEYAIFQESGYRSLRGADLCKGKFSSELILVLMGLEDEGESMDIQYQLSAWYKP
jgi:hypothetical protein